MIRMIYVGTLKEKYWKDAFLEYQKRLNKYTKIEMIEINDIDDKNKDVVLKKEAEKIKTKIKDNDFVITLEIEGKKMDSIQLANHIDHWLSIYANIVFVVGGSYGLDDQIKKRSNFSLSFSDLTFPHQLFRILLLEQIYRGFRILNKETYHK